MGPIQEGDHKRFSSKRPMHMSQVHESRPDKRLRAELAYIDELTKAAAPVKWEITDTHQTLITNVYRQAWQKHPVTRVMSLEPAAVGDPKNASNEDNPYDLGPRESFEPGSRRRNSRAEAKRYVPTRPKIHGTTLSVHEEEVIRKAMGSLGMTEVKDIAELELQIHPIFKWENWHTPFYLDEAHSHIRNSWIAMFPAFIVATKILTGTAAEHFYFHLMCGTLETRGDKTFLARSPLEEDFPYLRAQFKRLLRCLQQRLKFYWEVDSVATRHATTTTSFWSALSFFDPELEKELSCHYPDYDPELTIGTRLQAYIGINPKYMDRLLRSPHEADFHGNRELVRLHSQLAITLCHELCHAIFSLRGLQEDEVQMYETDLDIEVGMSFEIHLWGGITISADCLTSQRENIGPIVAREWKYISDTQHIQTVIGDTVLTKLFRDETWDDWPGFLRSIPRPSGQQSHFQAARYITRGNDRNQIRLVQYANGRAISPGCSYLNLVETGPGDEDIEVWYRRVKQMDLEAALKSGDWGLEKIERGVFGERLTWIGADSSDDEAFNAVFFPSDSEDEDEDDEVESEDEDGDGKEEDEEIDGPVAGGPVSTSNISSVINPVNPASGNDSPTDEGPAAGAPAEEDADDADDEDEDPLGGEDDEDPRDDEDLEDLSSPIEPTTVDILDLDNDTELAQLLATGSG